jgi:hypothetical protein
MEGWLAADGVMRCCGYLWYSRHNTNLGRMVTSPFISQISRCSALIAQTLHNGSKKPQQLIMVKRIQNIAYGMVWRYEFSLPLCKEPITLVEKTHF